MYSYGAGELMRLPLETLMPERYRERHAAHLEGWFSQPHSRMMNAGMELSCLRKDGSEFAAEASLSHIDTPAGRLGVAFVSDITERKKNEQALEDYQQQLQRLTASLIAAQESGNRELARELHDVFSQELAAVGMEISSLKEQARSGGELAERLSDLGKKISRLAREMHRTSRELHPAILEELGLEPALRQECEAFQERSGIPTRFTAAHVPAGLAKEVATCLYRVAQESLRNIAKHASGAQAVRGSLSGGSEGITLRIEDTGDGFDLDEALKKGGLGLISMEERIRLVNGKLTIQSQPDKGTKVTAFVPFRKESKHDALQDTAGR
jgi:PAS domain S-box-containing protein